MSGGLENVLAFMPEAVVGIDGGQSIIYFNASAEKTFGYSAADVIGLQLDILIPKSIRAQHRKSVDSFSQSNSQALVMHERREITAQRADGTIFPAEATIVRGSWGGVSAMFAILRDVTEQRLRQEAILASERKYRAILEGSPEAILIADPVSGRVTEVNAAAARLFGCRIEDLIGMHQSELHPAELQEKFRQTFREHIEIGRVLVPDGVIKKANGDVAMVEISASPISYNGQQRLVGFFRDVTEHVHQQQVLREALSDATTAIEAKKMFLANMSHELRTPLNGIIGFSDLIAREIHGPHSHPSYREYGDVIKKSGHHLLDIVNDVLDLSRMEAGKYRLEREAVILSEIVGDVRTMLATLIVEAGLQFSMELNEEASLLVDRRALKQMLINLISNAVKFTHRDGRITVWSSVTDDGETSLSVTDTGIGISPDRLASITEPFASDLNVYSKEKGGAGIGLSITKRLLELHGGRLDIESVLGVGSIFSLVFPSQDRTIEITAAEKVHSGQL